MTQTVFSVVNMPGAYSSSYYTFQNHYALVNSGVFPLLSEEKLNRLAHLRARNDLRQVILAYQIDGVVNVLAETMHEDLTFLYTLFKSRADVDSVLEVWDKARTGDCAATSWTVIPPSDVQDYISQGATIDEETLQALEMELFNSF